MLLKTYEATTATALYGTETLSSWSGFYLSRYDCALVSVQFGSLYKIFRDGTAIRCCSGQGSLFALGYDLDLDRVFTCALFDPAVTNIHNHVVGLKYDPQDQSRVLYTGLVTPGADPNPIAWGNAYYHGFTGNTIIKHSLVDGSTLQTITLTGTLSPFSIDRIGITADGWLIGMDFDNGSVGVVRFYNVYTLEQYESTIDRSKAMWVDHVHRNIWSIKLSDNKMQVYTFQVAPASFSAIAMGANRSRYREDDLSVTLRGSSNEVVPYWPVAWSLTSAEGHLEKEYTETDINGVATNKYCGPGADDFVGGSQTIEVETGY